MNFKTLLSISTFSLIGAINAAPISNDCPCNNRCQGYLLQFNNAYTCLTPANFITLKDKHCVNVKGFYSNQTNIYCIDEENSTIDMCNKSSKKYNYDKCMRNIVSKGREYKIDIDVYGEEVLKAENYCNKTFGGLFLSSSDDTQYICLKKNANEAYRADCIMNAKDKSEPMCVEDTNINVCDRRNGNVDYEKCLDFLMDIGHQNHISFEEVLMNKMRREANLKGIKTECGNKKGFFYKKSYSNYACLVKPDTSRKDYNETNDLQKSCEAKNGIYFMNSNNGEYICLGINELKRSCEDENGVFLTNSKGEYNCLSKPKKN
ncbi:hypothetical protein BCR32DRAFT_304329 [Anaeromyces robustus]|uniref:Uncharacterized protein n=1 Tax=Anaeromyces robustus TaxID=1754192 RepID=A0A1Y1WRR6_9FUNG|nr:hypothetical protein BCR32DRAFT_304329 [Anaeromyces robustus]|eukprot:ORX75958.1 hypothetical protein BCR32DRAFT_304329 [Anaeromyces robustus]